MNIVKPPIFSVEFLNEFSSLQSTIYCQKVLKKGDIKIKDIKRYLKLAKYAKQCWGNNEEPV